jgi:hypothetical protein
MRIASNHKNAALLEQAAGPTRSKDHRSFSKGAGVTCVIRPLGDANAR